MAKRQTSTFEISPVKAGLIFGAIYIGYKFFLSPVSKSLRLASDIKIMQFDLVGVQIEKGNITLNLYIHNPGTVNHIINAIVGQVNVITNAGTFHVGNLNAYGNRGVAALAQSKILLPVTENFVGSLQYFNALFSGIIKTQTLNYKGNITVDGQTYPLNLKFRLS